jgi:hypothetical protein
LQGLAINAMLELGDEERATNVPKRFGFARSSLRRAKDRCRSDEGEEQSSQRRP